MTVRRVRNVFSGDVLVHRARDLLSVDVTDLDGIPVTTPARTILDLPLVVRHPDRVQEAMDHALREGHTSRPYLAWRLDSLRKRGRTGVRLIEQLLGEDEGETVPRTVLERRFLRITRSHGRPPRQLRPFLRP